LRLSFIHQFFYSCKAFGDLSERGTSFGGAAQSVVPFAEVHILFVAREQQAFAAWHAGLANVLACLKQFVDVDLALRELGTSQVLLDSRLTQAFKGQPGEGASKEVRERVAAKVKQFENAVGDGRASQMQFVIDCFGLVVRIRNRAKSAFCVLDVHELRAFERMPGISRVVN
jgi:hypothetical protein